MELMASFNWKRFLLRCSSKVTLSLSWLAMIFFSSSLANSLIFLFSLLLLHLVAVLYPFHLFVADPDPLVDAFVLLGYLLLDLEAPLLYDVLCSAYLKTPALSGNAPSD